jgi:ATP-binding cassette subfamily B protein
MMFKTLPHTQQQGYSDCGVACLKTINNFYRGKDCSLEHLRVWSGTNRQGTSFAGLIQGANKLDLEAEGFQATTQELKDCDSPTILHVVNENNMNHFIVCFGWLKRSKKFIISDPAKGVIKVTEGDLRKI